MIKFLLSRVIIVLNNKVDEVFIVINELIMFFLLLIFFVVYIRINEIVNNVLFRNVLLEKFVIKYFLLNMLSVFFGVIEYSLVILLKVFFVRKLEIVLFMFEFSGIILFLWLVDKKYLLIF